MDRMNPMYDIAVGFQRITYFHCDRAFYISPTILTNVISFPSMDFSTNLWWRTSINAGAGGRLSGKGSLYGVPESHLCDPIHTK